MTTFHGPSGPISISYDRRNFLSKIKIERIDNQSNKIIIPIIQNNFTVSFENGEDLPNYHLDIKDEVHQLKYINVYNNTKEIAEALGIVADSEINTYLIKKTPDFFVKDLNMDVIYKMSYKFAEKGYSDGYGLHISLSNYQNFFSIVDPESFALYHTDPYPNFDSAYYTMATKLVILRPDNWILCKYDNNIVEDEILKNQIYSISNTK